MTKLAPPADRPKIECHDISRGITKHFVSVGLGNSLVTESDIGAGLAGLLYREIRTVPNRVN